MFVLTTKIACVCVSVPIRSHFGSSGLVEATSLRENEAAAFTMESGDTQTNIAALGKASDLTSKGMGGSFLQTTEASAVCRSLKWTRRQRIQASGQITRILKDLGHLTRPESGDMQTNIAALGKASDIISKGMGGSFLQTTAASAVCRLETMDTSSADSRRALAMGLHADGVSYTASRRIGQSSSVIVAACGNPRLFWCYGDMAMHHEVAMRSKNRRTLENTLLAKYLGILKDLGHLTRPESGDMQTNIASLGKASDIISKGMGGSFLQTTAASVETIVEMDTSSADRDTTSARLPEFLPDDMPKNSLDDDAMSLRQHPRDASCSPAEVQPRPAASTEDHWRQLQIWVSSPGFKGKGGSKGKAKGKVEAGSGAEADEWASQNSSCSVDHRGAADRDTMQGEGYAQASGEITGILKDLVHLTRPFESLQFEELVAAGIERDGARIEAKAAGIEARAASLGEAPASGQLRRGRRALARGDILRRAAGGWRAQGDPARSEGPRVRL